MSLISLQNCLCQKVCMYMCLCVFVMNVARLFSSTDIDECAENPGICPEGTECMNHDGFYECVCNEKCSSKLHLCFCMLWLHQQCLMLANTNLKYAMFV